MLHNVNLHVFVFHFLENVNFVVTLVNCGRVEVQVIFFLNQCHSFRLSLGFSNAGCSASSFDIVVEVHYVGL